MLSGFLSGRAVLVLKSWSDVYSSRLYANPSNPFSVIHNSRVSTCDSAVERVSFALLLSHSMIAESHISRSLSCEITNCTEPLHHSARPAQDRPALACHINSSKKEMHSVLHCYTISLLWLETAKSRICVRIHQQRKELLFQVDTLNSALVNIAVFSDEFWFPDQQQFETLQNMKKYGKVISALATCMSVWVPTHRSDASSDSSKLTW